MKFFLICILEQSQKERQMYFYRNSNGENLIFVCLRASGPKHTGTGQIELWDTRPNSKISLDVWGKYYYTTNY
ncbi:MAG: hypothetical protein ACD_62C00092G0001 [uncultured bacterium]|nr:MAG: hypothetical protein ACD_62C00092G0001 [uncultured bacterium]HLD44067.1 hypothetical protein [bacterium]